MKWTVEYDKLDAEQRRFVNQEIKSPNNIWIKGFAGSGKSMLLLYAVKKIIENEPNVSLCIIVYTNSLVDLFKTGIDEIGMSAVEVITYHRFKKSNRTYDYIFSDEVQDLSGDVLDELKRKGKKIFVAGDSNQSIYDNTVTSQQIETAIQAKPYALSTIHRLTREIINAVNKMMPNLKIWAAKNHRKSDGHQLNLVNAENLTNETRYVYRKAKEAAENGYLTAILFPGHDLIKDFINELCKSEEVEQWKYSTNRWDKPDYGSLNHHFLANEMPIEFVGSGYGSLGHAKTSKNVILMTYHSAKGLDFEYVFLPFLSTTTQIGYNNEETLLMVAMTRSRERLTISYSGNAHRLVNTYKSDCNLIRAEDELNNDHRTGNKLIDDLDMDF